MDRESLIAHLRNCIPSERLRIDEPMSAHTTFRVGGPVDAFVEPATVQELLGSLDAARAANAPWRIIGCGSNLLVADEGLAGLVVHLGPAFSAIEVEGTRIVAQAGATNADVAEAACRAGLSGYEFACGIPGSIGGAAIMNAGAYDGEFKDVCASVRCLSLDGSIIEVEAPAARWGYRRSMMADKGHIVLSATLQLVSYPEEKIRARMDDLTRRRAEKQPLELGSAGSTFKRPIGHYAGKLIEEAGMRGHTVGGAQVSDKHCGFVVNTGHATAADVRAVIADVQKAVLADSGVMLEPEVRMWGFDD